jgi:hypothetical protein
MQGHAYLPHADVFNGFSCVIRDAAERSMCCGERDYLGGAVDAWGRVKGPLARARLIESAPLFLLTES